MVSNNIRSADAVTADAGFVAQVIRQLVPEYRNEILVANFGISIQPESRVKEKLIYSNRLHKPLYRIEKILAAFNRFAGTPLGKDWRLVIAATGEQTENLKQIAAKSEYADRIEFAGWVDKAANAEWYARASVFVSVPESDATSISLLEAMAFGCIPVVSDLPANREWIQNGINGIVADDTDGDFITPALALDQEKVRVLNSALIMEHGTKEANRRKFLKLYDQLLK
jgi:glycosyltransferase involved in cell wall biosynthesis